MRSTIPTRTRALLILVGLLIGLFGLGYRDYVQTYGSGLNLMIEEIGGTATVANVDEQTGTTEVLFVGTPDEARAYVDQALSVDPGRLVLPTVIAIAGGVMLLAGLVLGWQRGAATADRRRTVNQP